MGFTQLADPEFRANHSQSKAVRGRLLRSAFAGNSCVVNASTGAISLPATLLKFDAQFYPEGIRSWMVKLDARPEGGMEIDPKFFVDCGELRAHQVRLDGGDASSDSYCYA
jgi:hypothetical protein